MQETVALGLRVATIRVRGTRGPDTYLNIDDCNISTSGEKILVAISTQGSSSVEIRVQEDIQQARKPHF